MDAPTPTDPLAPTDPAAPTDAPPPMEPPVPPRGSRRSRRMLAAAVVVGAILVASGLAIARPWTQSPSCPAIANHPEWSVARRWDEAMLDAIRRALPAPTVHARNLFHVSAAMWDAWATYDPQPSGYFTHEKQTASDVTAARNEAISYAAYRCLLYTSDAADDL